MGLTSFSKAHKSRSQTIQHKWSSTRRTTTQVKSSVGIERINGVNPEGRTSNLGARDAANSSRHPNQKEFLKMATATKATKKAAPAKKSTKAAAGKKPAAKKGK